MSELFSSEICQLLESFKLGEISQEQLFNKTGIISWSKHPLSYPDNVDELILPAVKVLNEHGFKTFESCQGGEGHCFSEPTVRFFGSEWDLIKAFEICQAYNMVAFQARRVYLKEDIYDNHGVGELNGMPRGRGWGIPFNEIEFLINSDTGTIFYPA
jgi:hypothetical protein